MGVGLVRSLQPWEILLIYCNKQFKKYIAPFLRLASGALSAPFWCLCQELSLSLFTVVKFLPHKSPEWSSLFTDPEAKFSSLDHKSNIVHCKLSVLGSVLVSFFNMELFSFPSTTYWRDYLFSIVYSSVLLFFILLWVGLFSLFLFHMFCY